jgi:hypothetical protein
MTLAAEASVPAAPAPAEGGASRRTLLPIAAPSKEPVSCCATGDASVSDEGVRDLVKQKYGQVALQVATGCALRAR